MSTKSSRPPRAHRQATNPRAGKALLMPLPRDRAREVSLRYHTAFEALRMHAGSAHGIAILLQMVILTGFIDDARRREIRIEVLRGAEHGLNVALERGTLENAWYLDTLTAELVGALIAFHDRQLETTTLLTLSQAMDRLDRVREQAVRESGTEPAP